MRIDGPQITGSFNLNGDTVADLDVFATTSSFNMMTASMATTGSNLFVGTQTSSGSIVPSVNNTYDLGSPTHQFRHVYISSGSLYVNGIINQTNSSIVEGDITSFIVKSILIGLNNSPKGLIYKEDKTNELIQFEKQGIHMGWFINNVMILTKP